MGLAKDALEIRNAGQRREDNPELVDMLYARLNRKGYLRRDCQRLIHQDRNVHAASMVVSGQADAMVTGLTRAFGGCFEDVLKVSDPAPSERIMTYAMFIRRGQTMFLPTPPSRKTRTAGRSPTSRCRPPRPRGRWASSPGRPAQLFQLRPTSPAHHPRRARCRAGAGATRGRFRV